MKVMIACGGTGGHLFPGLAVAEALRTRHHQVRLLVSEKAVDQTALGPLTGSCDRSGPIAVQTVPAVGYEGSSRLIRFCFRLAKATRGCAIACDEFRPDVVLGMGGFTSVPALFAVRWFRRRGTVALIHESNAVPGKANRWAGRFADGVAVGLAECAQFFGRTPVTVTGTPIRAALRERSRRGAKADARERLGLRSGRLTVLVAGGSQGAHAINQALAVALPWLAGRGEMLQFVHLSGPRDEQFVRESYGENAFEAKVMSFCSQMELAYGAADLVVARSGAATLAEIAAFGLPAILIPYPHAAGNHQWHNARVFERAGAARLIDQAQLNGRRTGAGQSLAALIASLVDDEGGRHQMATAARALAVDDAVERMTALLENCGQ
ncbi:MAG TPA: undecaprenyldiphospho-muramoylpentapeptide beta-N-acetylglucosaminyltransferase [Verrucomicrobiae bacterium]|nr:undecaprenyldiphospho-muramoylpentapeptide beta-N-acetylglucosaminyltransferase [Verrucomicrobiae bacterium]